MIVNPRMASLRVLESILVTFSSSLIPILTSPYLKHVILDDDKNNF